MGQKLSGKVIANFGDSIFGYASAPTDISTKIAELTGATVYNFGFGGCRMSHYPYPNFDAFSMCSLADAIASGDWTYQDEGIVATPDTGAVRSDYAPKLETMKNLDFSKVDIITIAYGTNDFTGGSVSLDNADDSKDTNSFAGALRYSIETLLTAYPNLKIFICTPCYRFWMDDNQEFVEDSDTKKINSVKLTDYVAKAIEVSNAYHLPFVDNYNIGINKFSRKHYFLNGDGTHHNKNGRNLIAEHVSNELF